MKKTIIASLLALAFILGTVYVSMSISAHNRERSLRESINSKIKDNKNSYSAMWAILTEQAGVAEKYSEDFKEIYPSMIDGRYKHGGGQMMQWITEHNPSFDISLYKQVMTSIEAQRETFKTNQTQLIDLSRQHNVLIKNFPNSFFLSDVQPIEIPVIVNNETNKAFDSGIEEKMNLFPRKVRDTIK